MNGTPEGTVDGTPEGTVDGTPEGTVDGTADGTAEGTVDEAMHRTADEATHRTADEAAYGIAHRAEEAAPPVDPAPPWALLAELSHGCPLRCAYCSNPVELIGRSDELTAEHWSDIFRQAADLGVVQTHLSGGEPLLRRDLPAVVAAADAAAVHTQLVTSGVGLNERRLAALTAAGLRSVQLSVQHADPAASEHIAGARSFAAKERAAHLVTAAGLPLGLNVVLHRANLDALDAIVELGLAWGASRIELANTQFYGWALRNRDALLPSRAQIAAARARLEHWRPLLAGRLELVWVVPDYVDGVAKPCMGGWGALSLTVAPDGRVYPCPAAAALPGLDAPNVRDHSLEWIWRESPAFTLYRGESWMREPCRSCELRGRDFGGCRCQAYALTGDAARTDPVCSRSPDHALVRALVDRAAEREAVSAAPQYAYREGP
ncbi:pyrroloquinoline quinone biosynthesis protein PqqE [Streptomyces clavuligerus]|uniref:pyrroloquinoline quinone biosynthesis protein PqqE n=1 Tax=Streptomyces clavuligerus TaxID=1901 RepID=UPI00081041E1|nr:pyrroloquinoline quinone biosynthesis protein PqqE [Streptomyces clavuligerus]ANW17342.1 pyrroloquinoline quinone biosynthesis protein PqqE [Streptomyces clavuligerus]AXU11893.1 pyrroloquinoline quinone biosynthesis protein PqqE [Streptomyces clavuligerus]